MKSFMNLALFTSLMLTLTMGTILTHRLDRQPAGINESYTIELQSLNVDANSRFHNLGNFFIRSTFNQKHMVEFGRNENWSIVGGENRALNTTIDIDPSWIQNDQLEFKIEIIRKGVVENVVLRCAQAAKGVSEYNRVYRCNVPGESAPMLTYRLAKKGSVPMSVAAQQNH